MKRKSLVNAIILCTVILVVCLVCAVAVEIARKPDSTLQTDPAGSTGASETAGQTESAAPSETETLPSEERYTLTFVGDCTLGTQPSWMYLDRCYTNLIGDNYDLPFQYVRSIFENDDCTFANLESVFANSGVPADKLFTFRGPTSYINILTGSSVEAVNLANNHSFDFGQAGYDSTVQTLKGGGVEYVETNSTTLFTTESGLTVGLYGIFYTLDEADMRSDVAKLRADGADIVIAAAHWGIEGAYHPTDEQTGWAHALIDAGVDIVWGHHPHVLQKIEEYNGGIIYYSLGNFSFGGNHNPRDKDTAILQQEIIRSPEGTISLGELTIIPCSLTSQKNYNDFQPIPLEESDERYARVLSKLDDTFPGPDLVVSYNTTTSTN
ncbi:MAG: CapA family protein [Oscillospiraceae bacterium]|nr:CapA family protein [Oscillospiraceae bacterium]